jgi:hypothetical protein
VINLNIDEDEDEDEDEDDIPTTTIQYDGRHNLVSHKTIGIGSKLKHGDDSQ